MAAPEIVQEELEKYGETEFPLPRIAIKFCVQCKWNLRAAYYAQELLSTFSTALGEVALIPATGGTFTITLLYRPSPLKDSSAPNTPSGGPDFSTSSLSPSSFAETRYLARLLVTEIVLWDRKAEGGFPETKELKNRVRNVIEPGRDLGHVDRSLKKAAAAAALAKAEPVPQATGNAPTPESSDGGVATSTTVQGNAAIAETAPTVSTEKCEDCH